MKALALAAYQAASPMIARLLKEDASNAMNAGCRAPPPASLDDFEACIAHLKLPIAHRRAIRTTNLLECLFGEERWRTKVIPHAFGERAVLKLMYAALIRGSQTWRYIVIGEFELKQIEELRTEFDAEFQTTRRAGEDERIPQSIFQQKEDLTNIIAHLTVGTG